MKRFSLWLSIPLLLVLVAPTRAATIDVNGYDDTEDAAPGDGVCRDAAGRCTVRAAFDEANALAGRREIVLPPGLFHLSIATSLRLRGAEEITLRGSGMATTVIDGSGLGCVLQVNDGGRLLVRDLTLRNGDCVQGGGLQIFDGYVHLARVRVSNNQARLGGGIFVSSGGRIEIEDSVVADNSARPTVEDQGAGGGIFNYGSVTLQGSLVARNTVPLGRSAKARGAGIFNVGTLAVVDSTLSSNVADSGSALLNFFDGTSAIALTTIAGNLGDAVATEGGSVAMRLSLLADNLGANCHGSGIVSLNHNLADDSSCNPTSADHVVSDALIGPLSVQANTVAGKVASAHALEPGSPAIDAAPASACSGTDGGSEDQLGALRPSDGDHDGAARCDIGAVERQPDAASVDLAGGRFRVRVTWRDFEGRTGDGRLAEATADTAFLWFFEPANIEINVKVLDACALNDRYWVFLAAATNVAFEVEVTDLESGRVESYSNPLGEFSRAVADTATFLCDD